MTVRAFLKETAERFREAGVPDPENDALLLLSFTAGKEPLLLRLNAAEELDAGVEERCDALCSQRLERVPLQYLTGETWFCGRRFHTDRRALIPRPETALLTELAISAAKACEAKTPSVLDLCCGSGCIGISIALNCPRADVTACDLSNDALALARENADALNAKLHFAQGDLFSAVAGSRFSLIVSNPPYIGSADCRNLQPEVGFEPIAALDGGPDGLAFYRRIAEQAPAFLEPQGTLLLEVGWDQAEAVCSLLHAAGFSRIQTHRDFQGIQRMVEGHWQ